MIFYSREVLVSFAVGNVAKRDMREIRKKAPDRLVVFD